jgi:hypothetical protein
MAGDAVRPVARVADLQLRARREAFGIVRDPYCRRDTAEGGLGYEMLVCRALTHVC